MKLASLFGHVSSKRKYSEWNGWPLRRCNVGLEWEFENGVYLRDVVSSSPENIYFTIHEDGSLRDHGIEIVTVGDGLYGEDLKLAFESMDYFIKQVPKHYPKKEEQPTCGYRTGFHAHLDIRDCEPQEIHNILMLYALLEVPIFAFAGKDRWKSNFCVPWFRSDSQYQILRCLSSNLSEKELGSAASRIKVLQRYSALNCQSIAKLGTLEFRHLENDLSEILTRQIDFVKIIMSLKKLACEFYERGLYGESLFEHLKLKSGRDLVNMLEFNRLPLHGWDYAESLMHAVNLVDFVDLPKINYFHDAAFDRFTGTHVNWR